MKGLPCAAKYCCSGPIENAHIRTGGMGRKADAEFIVPLCRGHHRMMHESGARWVAAFYNLDLPALAVETQRAWLAFSGGDA